MPKLFHTERGRFLLGSNEEITRWRTPRKRLTLPAAVAGASAEIWLCVAQYPGNREPLRVVLNGKSAGSISPGDIRPGAWRWVSLPVAAGRLRGGENRVELHTKSAAMNSWALAIEPGHARPASDISLDRGATWRSDAMGAHGVLRGEYLIRVLSHAKAIQPPRPPKVVHDDPNHPRLRELRDRVPASVRNVRDPWKQTLALRTWLAKSWAHEAHGRAYCPWDPMTILDWSRRDWAHGLKGHITMCVHFGSAMTGFATALGHKARAIVITDDINDQWGHFMSEVWNDNLGKWVLHDANLDVHYELDGPRSAFELADRSIAKASFSGMLRPGPGMPKGPPALLDLSAKHFFSGTSFRFTGVWSPGDFVSDPTHAPPNHGSVVYAETDFVWYDPTRSRELGMFPHRIGERAWFDAKPAR